MNFDTKYLIRWGIPGWIFTLTILPYLTVMYSDFLPQEFIEKNIFVVGASVTLIGVPVGYFLNQVQFLITWVIPKSFDNSWGTYFDSEFKVNSRFKENQEFKERYRFLLAKKHEVGSILSGFGLSTLIIFLINIFHLTFEIFNWVYFFIVLLLFGGWIWLFIYASKNILHYSKKIEE
ncbi:hypothetical protein J2B92_12345 [Lysinibacillus sphaericus]|uniref:hypothetical protein n=1 Tax=Lysinibacillus sphaericus TaxID=1421 RepID=UPI0018CF02B3|nr:hypothetical protein [Lysinibacillus sphaericus]MBG9756067.1 hypothetical protein [Lysinibacillus sphaericus]QTB11735.1 hypothetical protein J2B92_12345 [Lysinibacillus sphaericus]